MGALDVNFSKKDLEKEYTGVRWSREIAEFLDNEGIVFEVVNEVICVKSKPFEHDIAKSVLLSCINSELYRKELSCEALSEIRLLRGVGKDHLIPDIAVLGYKDGSLGSNGMYKGTPKLIIEILSSNREDDLVGKRFIYEQMQIPEYWIIDLDGYGIMQFVLGDKGYGGKHSFITEGAIEHHICGLSLDIVDLFEKILNKKKLFISDGNDSFKKSKLF